MLRKSFAFFLSFLGALFFVSCGNENSGKEIQTVVDTTSAKNTDTADSYLNFKYDMVISKIPFPFEMLDKLYLSKIAFSQSGMNPVANIAKYNKFNSKAIGLGIYGADLAYAVTYEQFQQIGNYVKNTKKLAEELDVPLAFNQEVMDKYNKFKDNKDSLAMIVYNSYTEVDKTLKNNERMSMAALVVTASWLEGLHLTTKTFVNAVGHEDKKDVYATIAQQGKHLETIISLLQDFKNEKPFADILADLADIQSVYSELSNSTAVTEKVLILLQQKVEKLRNKFVEGM